MPAKRTRKKDTSARLILRATRAMQDRRKRRMQQKSRQALDQSVQEAADENAE